MKRSKYVKSMANDLLPNWYRIPDKLVTKPRPVVTFVGLNIHKNHVDQSVWLKFSDLKRSEKLPIKYQVVQSLEDLPYQPASNSPPGILKINWLQKYLDEKVSIVVVFYKLDWTTLSWSTKKKECALFIKQQRSFVQNKNVKFLVVLIQSSSPIAGGEDLIAADCVSSLCIESDINIKQLNILLLGDQLHGYVVRLENLFYDLALNYFNQRIKKTLSSIDSLKKSTQQHLFVRYSFKVAYFYEVLQDWQNALKYYNLAYNNLLNVNYNMYNLFEIKIIASYVIYKTCKLMFDLDLQKNAIYLFESYIEHFQSKSTLLYEDHAWLSMQYKIFGDLFDETIKNGLKTNIVQQPGFYYHKATQHAQLRRVACQDQCQDSEIDIGPEIIEAFSQVKFYGQRPWSVLQENVLLQVLRTQEKQVDHSSEIIELFGKTIEQFKRFNCGRMRKNVIVEMAEEYFSVSDYQQALTLFLHVIRDYQNEHWWSIISDLIVKAYFCAYLTASVSDFMKLCLKAMYGKVLISDEAKKEMCTNFNSVLMGKVPSCNLKFPNVTNFDCDDKWLKCLQNPNLVELDCDEQYLCIDCKMQFSKSSFETIENLTIILFIQNYYCSKFELNEIILNIKINDKTEVHKLCDRNIVLKPNSLNKVPVEIRLKSKSDLYTPQHCEILDVDLVLMARLSLKFSNKSASKLAVLKRSQNEILSRCEFNLVKNVFSTSIVPTVDSSLLIFMEHSKPMLIGEWYVVKVKIKNDGSNSLADFVFDFHCYDSNEDTITLSLNKETSLPNLLYNDKLEEFPEQTSKQYEFFLKSTNVGEVTITGTVFYRKIDQNDKVSFTKTHSETIAVVKPFELQTKFMTPFLQNLTRLYVDEVFFMDIGIVSLSSHAICIRKTVIELKANVKLDGNWSDTYEKETILPINSEVLTQIIPLKMQKNCDHSYQLCDFKIFWNRLSDKVTNSTIISLHGLPVEYIPLYIDLELPSFGIINQNLTIAYTLYNKCDELIELKLELVQNEYFLFSGYKKVKVTILPNSRKTIAFNIYSLVSGRNALPELKLSSIEDCIIPSSITEVKIIELFRRTLPSKIYITEIAP